MKIRYFLLFSIVLASLFPTGCARTSEQAYFSYADESFHAEICGTLDGIEFSAEIGRDASDSSDFPFSGSWIRYTKPQSAADLTLRYDSNNCPTATLGSVNGTYDESILQGLLRPLHLLLEGGEPMSIRKDRGTTILIMPGYTLLLSENGIPMSVESDSVSLKTVWWETVPAVKAP